MNKIYKLFIILLLLLIPINIKADSNTNLVNIYLFHSSTCEHCKTEIKLLDKLEKEYSNIKIYKYEISKEDNLELYNKVKENYNIRTLGVPLTIIGDKAYIGYKEEHSKLKFIKTIEYYSRYGYIDKTGRLLGNNNLPNYEIKNNQISVDKFIKEYGNYNIIGNINTDNISLEATTVLTTILTELNIFTILILLISIILITKQPTYKDKLLSIGIYITSYLISNIILLLNIEKISILMYIVYIGIIIWLIIKYKSTKKNSNIINITIITLSILSNILKTHFHNNYINIYSEVLKLNKLSIFNIIIQYLINLIIIFIILIVLTYVFATLKRKIKNKKQK